MHQRPPARREFTMTSADFKARVESYQKKLKALRETEDGVRQLQQVRVKEFTVRKHTVRSHWRIIGLARIVKQATKGS